jgi:hypothetical protein
MSPQLEAALSVLRWLKKGEPMPAWIFPSLIGCPMCRAASIGSTRYNRTQPPRNRRRFRRRIDRA